MVGSTPKIIGINTRYYPAHILCPGVDQSAEHIQSHSVNPPPTVCVLVEGEIGDYAAYVGHGNPKWVAAYGNKITFAEAAVQFPGIEKQKYREA